MVGFYARADASQPIRVDLDNELVGKSLLASLIGSNQVTLLICQMLGGTLAQRFSPFFNIRLAEILVPQNTRRWPKLRKEQVTYKKQSLQIQTLPLLNRNSRIRLSGYRPRLQLQEF